eukprot:1177997-Prorocentrum_minimum.AAC.1
MGPLVEFLVDVTHGLPDPFGDVFGVMDHKTAARRLLQKNGAPMVMLISVCQRLSSKGLWGVECTLAVIGTGGPCLSLFIMVCPAPAGVCATPCGALHRPREALRFAYPSYQQGPHPLPVSAP